MNHPVALRDAARLVGGPPRFVAELERFGEAPAVRTGHGELSYAALAARARAVAHDLGGTRRLVLIEAENSLDWLTTYLGSLLGGHTVLLADGRRSEHARALAATYDVDVHVRRTRGQWTTSVRRAGTAHHLHPDLSVLLGTSGTTGSPKLVRLSAGNLDANATAIAQALDLGPSDIAMANLPVHYSYGLSIVHSHLAVGGSLVLTPASVLDPCFWDLLERTGATGISGVPHTFDLLDRSGLTDRELPTLRSVTAAGGALRPEIADRFRRLAEARGWLFYAMYGQTEATARMAVLPPAEAATRPRSAGVAVPGGAFRVDPVPQAPRGFGEIVYTGPNVMMGYASGPGDLDRGYDLTELRTGDLGRVDEAGFVEIVGRLSRFTKIMGLRIDLDHVEADVAARLGTPVAAVELAPEEGGGLGLLTPICGARERILTAVTSRYGIPATSVVVQDGRDLPRLASGKIDYPTVRRLAGERVGASPATRDSGDLVAAVVALYREVLQAPGADEGHSFVDLGGDSLSYVEVSVRLEALLGTLPADWHERTPAALAQVRTKPVRRWSIRRLETTVVLRALAVLFILANHAHLATLPGGAHTLLVVAGYNLARFQLGSRSAAERTRGVLRTIWRVWLPSAVWIGVVAITSDRASWRNVLMLNQVLGDWSRWGYAWFFWYVEVLVALLLAVAIIVRIPVVDRLDRAYPFGLPMALVGLGVLARFGIGLPDFGQYRGANALVISWLFTTGWAAARATTSRQRLLLTLVPILTVPGFWTNMPIREAVVIAGTLLLIWVPSLPMPRLLTRPLVVVAGASLFIYLVQFEVFHAIPRTTPELRVAAAVTALALGLAYWRLWTTMCAALTSRLRTAERRRVSDGREPGPGDRSTPPWVGAAPSHQP